jgi:quinone-modifying oxidoreductase subunit QmoA
MNRPSSELVKPSSNGPSPPRPEGALLVVGGGIAGLTAAIEAAEAGHDVYIVERGPTLGGRVARFHKYFPKLCPPQCGLEINFRRIRAGHRQIKVFTLAELISVGGSAGAYEVQVTLHPRFILEDRCTACGRCAEVCPVERPSELDYGLGTTKAAYLPSAMAFPMKYVIDGDACLGADACGACAEVCPTDAVVLDQQPRSLTLLAGSIVLATGWKPYDISKLDLLGGGRLPDVISNVMMERLAAPDGPTDGRLVRPSDQRPAKRVAFVQCAGSRDRKHLPYCSSICCLGSLKQAAYVREADPEDGEAWIFYIDLRAPGMHEAFYHRLWVDPKVHFVKGKVAKIRREGGELVVEADDMVAGRRVQVPVDMVVLAAGMQPSLAGSAIPGLPVAFDEHGFAAENREAGIFVAGVAKRPIDVIGSTRDATGAALKAHQRTVSA